MPNIVYHKNEREIEILIPSDRLVVELQFTESSSKEDKQKIMKLSSFSIRY